MMHQNFSCGGWCISPVSIVVALDWLADQGSEKFILFAHTRQGTTFKFYVEIPLGGVFFICKLIYFLNVMQMGHHSKFQQSDRAGLSVFFWEECITFRFVSGIRSWCQASCVGSSCLLAGVRASFNSPALVWANRASNVSWGNGDEILWAGKKAMDECCAVNVC